VVAEGNVTKKQGRGVKGDLPGSIGEVMAARGCVSTVKGQEGCPVQSMSREWSVHSKVSQGGLCMKETTVSMGDNGWGGLVRQVDEEHKEKVCNKDWGGLSKGKDERNIKLEQSTRLEEEKG